MALKAAWMQCSSTYARGLWPWNDALALIATPRTLCTDTRRSPQLTPRPPGAHPPLCPPPTPHAARTHLASICMSTSLELLGCSATLQSGPPALSSTKFRSSSGWPSRNPVWAWGRAGVVCPHLSHLSKGALSRNCTRAGGTELRGLQGHERGLRPPPQRGSCPPPVFDPRTPAAHDPARSLSGTPALASASTAALMAAQRVPPSACNTCVCVRVCC